MLIAIGTTLLGWMGKSGGATDKLKRVVGVGAVIVIAVIAFIIWLAIHDSNVRDEALDDQDAIVNAAVIDADRSATAAQDQRESDFGNSQGGIENAVDNARAKQPAEVKKPVGPASRAYYEELRRQQEERRANRR